MTVRTAVVCLAAFVALGVGSGCEIHSCEEGAICHDEGRSRDGKKIEKMCVEYCGRLSICGAPQAEDFDDCVEACLDRFEYLPEQTRKLCECAEWSSCKDVTEGRCSDEPSGGRGSGGANGTAGSGNQAGSPHGTAGAPNGNGGAPNGSAGTPSTGGAPNGSGGTSGGSPHSGNDPGGAPGSAGTPSSTGGSDAGGTCNAGGSGDGVAGEGGTPDSEAGAGGEASCSCPTE